MSNKTKKATKPRLRLVVSEKSTPKKAKNEPDKWNLVPLSSKKKLHKLFALILDELDVSDSSFDQLLDFSIESMETVRDCLGIRQSPDRSVMGAIEELCGETIFTEWQQSTTVDGIKIQRSSFATREELCELYLKTEGQMAEKLEACARRVRNEQWKKVGS